MPAALFALGTAVLFALHNVLIKKGLATSNSTTAVFITIGINSVFLWGFALPLTPLHYLATPAILIFLGVGLFQPGLTRLLTVKGIDTLGVAIADPIRASTPMFSSLMAILFLGEQMTFAILCGTILIILGVTVLSYQKSAGRPLRLLYIFYPILASFLVGLSQVARKFGLAFIPHPFLAAAVTATSSFAVISSLLLLTGQKGEGLRLTRECLPYYLSAGVAISMAMASLYYALSLGEVIVVIPVTSSGPFFALTLSAIFLRDIEQVTLKIVLGAGLIVMGVLLVTLWKSP